MRRVVITAAAMAVIGLAGCGESQEDPETPEQPETGQEEAPSSSTAEQWESAGELDNMPADVAAGLEPPVSPDAVVTAFTDAGLADGEPVEVGTDAEPCDHTDCVRAFTIGEVTVMMYMSDDMASAAAEAVGDAHAEGSVVLHYAPTETPEEVRGDYEAALADALAP
ncbi:hypothetical protein [Glycomyces tarimensis]